MKAALVTTVVVLLLVSTVACSAGAAGQGKERELVVFAASSLTDVLQEMAGAFQAENPDVSTVFNFAGSQQLRTQLEHGAQADIFVSANWKQMDAVAEAGLVSGEPADFASNRLVVIVSPLAQLASLGDLARPGTKLVLAQPEVPVGGYSRTVIDNLAADPQLGTDYAAQVLANVVSEETNVRNVAQKVALGEADAGIVYQTDAMVPDIAEQVRVIEVPDQYNIIASYPIALLKGSEQPETARQFIDFALSARGRQVLVKHGFGSPGNSLPTTGADGR